MAYEISVHDDGVTAYGGTMTGLVGKFGSGKSTFIVQLEQAATYLPAPYNKHSSGGAPKYPETVIHRGLENDHWNCQIPQNFQKSFPDAKHVKPLRVHLYYKDRLAWYEERDRKRYQIQLQPIEEITTYGTVEDLYSNLLMGGINIVYEPREYYLPPEVLDRIMAADLTRQKKRPTEAVRAPSAIWWYEFLEALIRLKYQDEFFLISIDEAHQVFPACARGDLWHLVGWFSETMISFRKNNISMMIGTQDTNDMDYRVTDRLSYYIWLRGSRPKSRISMVSTRLIGILPRHGWAILEEPKERFGRLPFTRIPNQPPIVKTVAAPPPEDAASI
ncbi:hypothetical protein J2129_002766 [Methanofollis sp. W23]|uniref:hypothetical protein n=1 Tax=Methanofollis sp. W23 TaxID=2817849 RepID=UPI001AE932B1|nr:hypothetical protein [Methanofollis sp. W23]MBP2147253.1 hypothetical protein [Methanofollis sp. W23]